jgi:SAM-dependent methyltransferase
MRRWLRSWLIEPGVRHLDVDSPDFSMAHRVVLQSKAMLRHLFAGFYHECHSMDLHYFGDCPGKRLEIGSGAGLLKQIYPEVITSDIKPLPVVDAVLRAEKIPFPSNSLRAIYAINVFHHLPRPNAFLEELLRVLHPGGGAVLIEPYYGPLARRLYRNLHETEDFDADAPGWESVTCMGPFSNANQALAYMVFKRDYAQFAQKFPELELVVVKPHTHLLYFVSGGVNFRQLAPDSLTPLVKLIQQMLSPFDQWLALQHTIVLRKRF